MLASKGFIYLSQETAGIDNKYHSHCDCKIVPDFTGKTELSHYHADTYRSAYDEAKKSLPPKSAKRYQNVLSVMRKQHPEIFSDGTVKYAKPSLPWKDSQKLLSMKGQEKGSRRSWQKRQEAVGVPLSVDGLDYHEIVFLEKFRKAGNSFEWIPKSSEGESTNDFIWNREDGQVLAELKSLQSTKYSSLAGRVSDAVKKAKANNVTKDIFIVDLGDSSLKPKELYQYSLYNIRHEEKIKELWIWHSEGLTQVELKK